jgi:hypothetical protein
MDYWDNEQQVWRYKAAVLWVLLTTVLGGV